MSNQRDVTTIVEDKSTSGLGVALKGKVKGDPVADVQLPVYACEDSSGNEAKIPLAADGGVAISTSSIGTKKRNAAIVIPGSLNTDTDIAVITLVAGETYMLEQFEGSSNQPADWKVEHDDNGTPDLLVPGTRNANSNAFSDTNGTKVIQVVAGVVGVQELKLIVKQVRGPLSDAHGSIGAIELV